MTVRGGKQLVVMTRLREHLIAKGHEEEAIQTILLVADRALEVLDDLLKDYFDSVEEQINDPVLGIPAPYVDGVILGMGLYLKFLPKLFPEVSQERIAEVFAYRDLIDTESLIPEEPPPDGRS